MTTVKKRDLYKYNPERGILKYLRKYIYDDLTYIIFEYVISFHCYHVKSMDLGVLSDRLCVYENKIYMLVKQQSNIYRTYQQLPNIFVFDSICGVLIEKVDIPCVGYNDIFVNNKYIYLQKDRSSLQIYMRNNYKYLDSISHNIHSVFVNEENIYISGDTKLTVYSCDGIIIKNIFDIRNWRKYGFEGPIQIFFVDNTKFYFGDLRYKYSITIYDKGTLEKVSRIWVGNGFLCKTDGIYTFRYINQEIHIYDTQTSEKLRSIKLKKRIKFFNDKTKPVNISITNGHLYIFDNNNHVHIFK